MEEKIGTLPPRELDSFSTLVGAQFDYNRGILNPGTNMGLIYVEMTDFDTPGRRNGLEVLKEAREVGRDAVTK